MPEGVSVGSRNGQYVELDTLKDYLRAQFGEKGARITNHKWFCRRFGALAMTAVCAENGAKNVLLIPAEAVPEYLATQYRGMGGEDIAYGSPNFLRNIPTVRVSDLSLNLLG